MGYVPDCSNIDGRLTTNLYIHVNAMKIYIKKDFEKVSTWSDVVCVVQETSELWIHTVVHL